MSLQWHNRRLVTESKKKRKLITFPTRKVDRSPKVFCEKASICVWVISTNNNKPIQIKLQCCFFSLLKLESCPRKVNQSKLWKSHTERNLRLYICFNESCNYGYVRFLKIFTSEYYLFWSFNLVSATTDHIEPTLYKRKQNDKTKSDINGLIGLEEELTASLLVNLLINNWTLYCSSNIFAPKEM